MGELTPQYLAGFFDGEGSVCITYDNSGQPKLRVSLANNYRPVIEQVKQQFSGSINRSSGNCYQWWLYKTEKMFQFLTYVKPYLIVKQKEVTIALTLLTTMGTSGTRYTEQEVLVKARLCEMFMVAVRERNLGIEGI